MSGFNLALQDGEEVVVWGLGFYGMNCLDFLTKFTALNISAIVDSQKYKQHSSYYDIPVISPDHFFSTYKGLNCIVVITIRNAVAFDTTILKEKGIKYQFFDQIFLSSNAERLQAINERLGDDFSSLTFSSIVGCRMLLSETVPQKLITENQYFCLPEFGRRKNQALVDCGAYIGDTFERWLENNEGNICAYVGIDPVLNHKDKFLNRLLRLKSEYDLSSSEIKFINKFVSHANDGATYILAQKDLGSATSLLNSTGDSLSRTVSCAPPPGGGGAISSTTVDYEVDTLMAKVPHTRSIFLKMDIEGGEFDALRGSANTLRKYRPLMAISLYHRIDDLVRIPEYLMDTLYSYKFYIRHHSRLADETVLYCVPAE